MRRNFKPAQLERFKAVNPELAANLDLLSEARVVSHYFAKTIPAPLQTRRYAGRVINDPDGDSRRRRVNARMSRENALNEHEIERIIVMGEAALRGEHVDSDQLALVMAALESRTHMIGIIPEGRMLVPGILPGDWPEEVELTDRANLIVVGFTDGTSWTSLRDGELVTPYTPEGTRLNDGLLNLSAHLSSLAMFGQQAGEIVARLG